MFDPTAMSCVSPNTVEKCAGVTTTVQEPEISTFRHIFQTNVILTYPPINIDITCKFAITRDSFWAHFSHRLLSTVSDAQ